MESAATIQVACPACRSPLTAPQNYAGATVQCPRCNCQMVLPGAGAGAATLPPSPAAKGPLTPAQRRAENLLPPTASAPPVASATPASARVAVPMATPVAKPPTAAGGTAQMKATFRPEAAKGDKKPVAVPAETPSNDSIPTARFIAKAPAAAVDTPVSKLPALQLADAVEKTPRATGASMRGPLMTMALIGSVLLSAALLFWEPTTTKVTAPGQDYAWEELETFYFGDGASLKPYQQMLRQAQQAHHRGQYRQRDSLLRKVLDMLHAERPNPAFGLTGYQTPEKPNDRHLEETIMTLLRDRK